MPTNPYHHGDLRAALIDEAGRVLERDGADAVSFRALARRLGVSHAAPRHHFDTVAELHERLAADGYRWLADEVDSAVAGPTLDPAARFVQAGQAVVRFAFEHQERYRLMFSYRLFLGEVCPEALEEAASVAFVSLSRAVRGENDAWQPGDPVDGPELGAWSLVHGALMLWIEGQFPLLMDELRFRAMLDRNLALMADALTDGEAEAPGSPSSVR